MSATLFEKIGPYEAFMQMKAGDWWLGHTKRQPHGRLLSVGHRPNGRGWSRDQIVFWFKTAEGKSWGHPDQLAKTFTGPFRSRHDAIAHRAKAELATREQGEQS